MRVSIRKTKQEYYNNLDHKNVADNKSFWKYIKPLFSDKSSNFDNITLVEKDLILEIKINNDIAETFNDSFTSVGSKLYIPRYQDPLINIDQTENRTGHPILRIIEQYKSRPSIIVTNNPNMDRRF